MFDIFIISCLILLRFRLVLLHTGSAVITILSK